MLATVEEQAEKGIAERIGHIQPVALETVLLFPVVENGVIRGQPVHDGLGSPVLYRPGTDLDGLQFDGVDRWPVKRYMVWARGYYMEGIPRLFLHSDTVWGRQCFLVELTPIKPGTSREQLESAILDELKKGEITVEPPIRITDGVDSARLFRASQVESWLKDPLSGYRRRMVNWGQPGSKVQFILTEEDFKLIKSYLRGEHIAEPGATPNGSPAAPLGDRGVTEGPPSVS